MKPASFRPRVHLFVCANRRSDEDPLGSGCGERGERVFRALKDATRASGLVSAVWVTRTHCLGLCPKTGCAVAAFAGGRDPRHLVEVEPEDVDAVLAQLVAPLVNAAR